MAYNANNYQNNTHNGNIQYGSNSGMPNGMPPPFVTSYSQQSTFGATSWNVHNGYRDGGGGGGGSNQIPPFSSYSQQQQHLGSHQQQQHLGSRSPANRAASMQPLNQNSNPMKVSRPVGTGQQTPSHIFRLSGGAGTQLGGSNGSNGTGGYGAPFIPSAHRNPRPNLFGGGAPGSAGSFQLPQQYDQKTNDNPPWNTIVPDYTQDRKSSKHPNNPQQQQRQRMINPNPTKIFGKPANPASPKSIIGSVASGAGCTGAVKINGCGDTQRSMLGMLQNTIDKANATAGMDEKREEIGKPGDIAAAATQSPSANALDKTAWRLQAPGMQLFPGKNAKNGSLGAAASRQGKAERKNTNLEPKAWLYAWLGFRHIRPTYTHETIGQRPDQHFKCSLTADGFDKVAQGVAQSKKEAQTEAAWNFIDWLGETEKLMSHEIEHVQAMKKKAKGISNSIRDLGKPPPSDKEVNVADEEQIRTQMEDAWKNKMKVVTVEPPWVRGEQQVNTMDEFWRRKDLMSENCPGGPAVTTTTTIGGAGVPTTVKSGTVANNSSISNNNSQEEVATLTTTAETTEATTTTDAAITSTPSDNNIQQEDGTTEDAMTASSNSTPTTPCTEISTIERTGNHSSSPTIPTTTPTNTPPPVIITSTMASGGGAAAGGTEVATVQPPQHRIPPPYAGAQPGSPFPLHNSAHHHHQHQQHNNNKHPHHQHHHQIPINYMVPPPPFLPPDMYGMPPPPIVPNMLYDHTLENQMPQSQTADNIRDMLDDITKELESEGGKGEWTPRRNETLEPKDLLLLEHCKDISMNSDQYKVLQKMTQIAETSLKTLSDALVRSAAVDNNRADLVEMLDDAKNNNKVRILQRKEVEVSDEQKKMKEELNRLRIIRSVFRVGHFAMGNLLQDAMMSELVLFTQSVPTRLLLDKIMKLLPTCIDKSLNLGVTEENENIVISGEILNEKVACRIHLTSRKTMEDDIIVQSDNALSMERMMEGLQLVRRVNFWKEVCLSISPIMDKMARIFLQLRNTEGHVLHHLSEWQLLLVIYFSIGSCDSSMLGPVDATRRVFEVLSSGALFYSGGLRDPVESEPTDFVLSTNLQDLEDIALWAGKSLRQAAFDSIEDVFSIADNNKSLPTESGESENEIETDPEISNLTDSINQDDANQ